MLVAINPWFSKSVKWMNILGLKDAEMCLRWQFQDFQELQDLEVDQCNFNIIKMLLYFFLLIFWGFYAPNRTVER